MKLKKLPHQLLLFTSKTRKDLTLSFFRMEEYYESGNKNLNRRPFTVFDFLNESMNKDGNIDYFSTWSGFNIPGHVVREWMFHVGAANLTNTELKLTEQIFNNIDIDEKFYVIGALEGDKEVIDHEIAHGLYYLNGDYKSCMENEIYNFYKKCRGQYSKMVKNLKRMGYGDNVIRDEIQAYLSTSKKKELIDEFDLDYDIVLPFVKQFRKVLRRYNTF
jgi:hypothetical protein